MDVRMVVERKTRNCRTRLFGDFTFHNVGEGLFYSGQIGNFNFIYDCGASNKKHLALVISKYITHKLRKRIVDLLIISHLHDDHIAGLETLLNRVSVKTVILPYLNPIERCMVALRRLDLRQWFYDFWADPITFLFERGVKQIVLVGGHEPFPPEHRPGEEPYFEGEDELHWDKGNEEDEDLKEYVKKNDRQVQRFFDGKSLLAKNHKENLVTKGTWLFRFFNCKVKELNMHLFIQCINKNPIIQHYDLISIIRNKSLLSQLKDCYKKLHGDFNDTSLVVYHAPMTMDKPFDQFLTGDINLNTKLTEIEKHYDGYLSRVRLALVPHHGSQRNWNRTILAKTSDECLWVTSASIFNKYHPSFKVICDLIRDEKIHFWSNEFIEISTSAYLTSAFPRNVVATLSAMHGPVCRVILH